MRRIAAVLALALAAPASAEGPMTLDEALAVAARESPDLAAARADTRISAADRAASVSAVLPRLDLSGSFGHQFAGKTPPQHFVFAGLSIDTGPQPASDQEAYAASLQLTQAIFDWRSFGDIRSAGFSLRAAERQYDEASLSVAFDVTRRFYEVLRADRTLEVLQKTVARSEDLVARSDALFAAGRAPKSDTLQARVNLANDRVAVEAQRIRVAQARTALAQALGRTGEIDAVPPAALEGAPRAAPEPPPVDELLAAARARRPAVAAEVARVQAADAAVSSARAGWLPSLSAQASYSRQGQFLLDSGPAAYGVFGDPTRAYTAVAQLVLTMNLLEGGLTRANVHRAEASADRARAAQVRTGSQVAKEVADARAGVVALAREVAIAAESFAIAEQGLSLARQRLEAGLASQLEIRDASLKLQQSELSLVQARIDHAVARADLARAVGGGF